MALSQSTQLGLATASFGVLSFVLAELKKPPYGTPIKVSGDDAVVCQFRRTQRQRWARCRRSPPRAAPGSAPSPSSSPTAAGASRGRPCSATPRSTSSSTSP
ncbi:hypothetical protein PR202_gb01498 [Eleusine coracana subsp. coracana]|uniref:Uncharacterized protein n=1 Tax=Eleusine coracana subsp. coracana TaxID=191504 RepID=A0AAV5DW13_ELECO|nr:hypothetical protein PR202_gb01498 [Eleusine coracana subsp. coracana]